MARAAVRLAGRPSVSRNMVRTMAPSALPLFEQVLAREAPLKDEIPTIAEARMRFGRTAESRPRPGLQTATP
jgi:hypothetical protein